MGHQVKAFFDKETYTLTYIVFSEKSKDAIIIDSVLDYDQASSSLKYSSIDQLMGFITQKELNVHYALETHAHADHLTAAIELKKRIPGLKIGIGRGITKVQEVFKNVYNFKDFNTNGVQWDVLLEEGNVLEAGTIKVKTIYTPGHTPACSSYVIDDFVFTGDALFMPDYGTGRCDFPAGSANELYHSIRGKIYQLPDETKVFTGHDYQPGGRELKYQSTIKEQKETNIHLKENTTEEEFVEFRTKRDATLKAPKLLYPSIQVNIDGGKLPAEEDNGIRYLKIPLKGNAE